MSLKRSAATSSAIKPTDGDKFRWTAENERKLLILVLGRTIGTDDYRRIAEAIPGANYNGVRIRASKMRIEQRKLFSELGWNNLDGSKLDGEKKPVKSQKRKGDMDEVAVKDGGEKPAKKMKRKHDIDEVAVEDGEEKPAEETKKDGKGDKGKPDGEDLDNDLSVKADAEHEK